MEASKREGYRVVFPHARKLLANAIRHLAQKDYKALCTITCIKDLTKTLANAIIKVQRNKEER